MSDPRIEFFDNVADEWDKQIRDYTQSEAFNNWWRTVKLRRGYCVIEIGCGTGRLLPKIWSRIQPEGRLYALDFSEKMLAVARQRCSNIPVNFLSTPAFSIPLPKNSCDIIFLVSTFPHLRPRRRSLKEISRILKSSTGKLYLAHFDGSRKINEMHRSIGGPVKSDAIFTREEMTSLFENCGLRVISIEDASDHFYLTAKNSIA